MKYEKKFEIKGKIISKENIKNLIQEIKNVYLELKDVTLKINANFDDGFSISCNDVSIFENLSFNDSFLNKISICIEAGYNENTWMFFYCGNYESSIDVKSGNDKFYHAICNIVNINIKKFKKQKKIYILNDKPEFFLFFYSLLLILEIVLFSYIAIFFNINVSIWHIFAFATIPASILTSYLMKYIEKNFPNCQFDFGDNSVNKPKKSKINTCKIIEFIIANIVIPFLLKIISK